MFTLKSIFGSLINNLNMLNTVLMDDDNQKENFYNIRASAVSSIEALECISMNLSKFKGVDTVRDYDESVNYVIADICHDITNAINTLNTSNVNKSMLSYRTRQYIEALLEYETVVPNHNTFGFSYIADVCALVDKIDAIILQKDKLRNILKIKEEEVDIKDVNRQKFICGLIRLANANTESVSKLLYRIYNIK